ncbi:MAG: hypothetical protein NVSMB53_11470 [Gemmatimonadaceae bacterium]
MLEDGGIHGPLNGGQSEGFSFRNESWNASGEILIVQSGCGEAFDQQTVFSQYENGVNSGALAKRAREISDVGH